MRVLIAEDDRVFALDLQDMLEDWGHTVIGPYDCVAACEEAIAGSTPDVALLDISLRDGESSAPLAARLRDLRVPIFAITGRSRVELRDVPEFKNVPTLTKPISDDMVKAIFDALAALPMAKKRLERSA